MGNNSQIFLMIIFTLMFGHIISECRSSCIVDPDCGYGCYCDWPNCRSKNKNEHLFISKMSDNFEDSITKKAMDRFKFNLIKRIELA
jgi:hypothetical protein